MRPEDYKLIPMSEITDEARKIAVAWMECDDKHWIGQKHKLASDIMNYAKRYAAANIDQHDKELLTKFVNFLIKEDYAGLEILDEPSAIDRFLILKK